MLTMPLLATTTSLLPESIGLSQIASGSGVGAWVLATFAVLRGWPIERVQRMMLLGTITGGTLAAVALSALLLFS
ncbi:hypothetical protein Q5424_23760 [Conexibacter sp. JD483]|uniref:hypothetical protein n=1 Tax=unclassified Conexibacter TaxID=2627773 RepID=UPI002719E786|nr:MULTISPECIES: hypothetical protein [unclassified Conexibacter]MDO8188882.1 hypothetical protein [Conexibacter sp. CPCC 205706]MDO8201672.1 hypothetical protein [Conexibacter sp. CPCC 205762]MDR9372134.1 hypothetical protein [Conexibacter sp. JD483]